MNKRRIADLAQEWNEVIERLNYDDFQAWFHLLPEKERLIVAEKLVAAIIYFCRDYLTVPQDELIWEMEETMEEFEMNQEGAGTVHSGADHPAQAGRWKDFPG